ncbi:MAG: hypothetical protein KBS97_01460, partial [Firmicutes bacterium]|nr:hypothetical protein [Candidatus Fiminaster equi]
IYLCIIIDMRQYVRNILIYLVALLAIIAFIALFANSLEFYDSVKQTWITYKVNSYIGKEGVCKGTIIPVFGFALPLLIAVILIVESFKKSWSGNLKVINTILAIILALCAVCVLLTKELFLSVNNLGETTNMRNGAGPVLSAISSIIGSILLLLATWLPFKTDIKFIDR